MKLADLGNWMLVALAAVIVASVLTGGSTALSFTRAPDIPSLAAIQAHSAPDRGFVSRNPFRQHRAPSAARYQAEPAPVIERPLAAILTGIMLGAQPTALVDGIPGQERTVAYRRGDWIAGYTLVAAFADSAILADSTGKQWTIRPRRRSE